jgi:micrococcal nuclease
MPLLLAILAFFGWALTGPAYTVDGDTLRVAGIAVRLQGVDAEEMNEPNGPWAKAVMRDIIGNSLVSCALNGERSYNRVVAVCYVRGVDVGAEIIRRGAALDCAHYSHGRYRHLEPPGARARLRQARYC